ncbi:MAG: hypothetical protein HQ509_00150, partial [Candidatus Marinimicrobia bacterium]|nr:hypothetical protein [Candidatus Neomarinimicrobiota bacterium]
MKNTLIILSICLKSLYGTILHVPGDHSTIQAGITASQTGDTVLVQDGLYYENLLIMNQSIVLGSLFIIDQDSTHIYNTIIDGQNSGGVIQISATSSLLRVIGFTIQNGNGGTTSTSLLSGGITCRSGSEPQLEHLIIQNNYSFFGAGIIIDNSSPIINNCIIRNNDATIGGGVFSFQSTFSLSDSQIDSNNSTGNGGGCFLFQSTSNNTNVNITNNQSGDSGGGVYSANSDDNLMGVNISGNYSINNGGGLCFSQSNMTIFESNIYNNSASNDGGGIFCALGSSGNIENSRISHNCSQNTGGGIYATQDSDIELSGSHVILNNAGIQTGGLFFTNLSLPIFDATNRNSIYLNFGGFTGNEVKIDSGVTISMPLDTFTVINPTDYHCTPLDQFSIDISHGKVEQVSADLYVSPNGSNENSGLTSSSPLRTIHFALSIIVPDVSQSNGIHLANGVYSPSTNNEYFPIIIPEYVFLIGSSQDSTILDAEQTDCVLIVEDALFVNVSNLTVTGGFSHDGGGIRLRNAEPLLSHLNIFGNYGLRGGGVFLENSNPWFLDLTVSNNTGEFGGGLYLSNSNGIIQNLQINENSSSIGAGVYLINSSNLIFKNTIIEQNQASQYGGGIYCDNSDPTFRSLTVRQNMAQAGGGIYFTFYSSPEFNEDELSNIYLNTAGPLGHDLFSELSPGINAVLDTFTVFTPTEYHAYPQNDFTFSIQNGLVEQVSEDVYVSPDGNNLNSGLTSDLPLKTISFALSKAIGGLTNPITVYLLTGVYSQTSNNESFPISWMSNINLVGESPETTILDAEGSSNVIVMDQDFNVNIENLTIQGGHASQGGGIQLIVSHPNFRNVHFVDNSSENHGGGISANFSNPTFTNVLFRNNTAVFGGAAYFLSAYPEMDHVVIANNAALGETGRGGGIYLQNTTLDIAHGSFSNNYSQDGGGAIFLYASTATMINSILWNNIPNEAEFSPTFTASNFVSVYNDIR